MTRIIFFDVEGTLLYKDGLYETIRSVLEQGGFSVPVDAIGHSHRIVSGLIPFPDETSREFYNGFNRELLYSLGILPWRSLLDDLYDRCKRLPWRAHDDTSVLSTIPIQKAILSNWDETLKKKLSDLIPYSFDKIFGSAQTGLRKPDKAFYRKAFAQSAVPVEQILYIGDSVKLDIEPALSLGVESVLIDRNDQYPWYFGKRIRTLTEILSLL